MTSGALEFLIDWFAIHCDGDWEHSEGIRIATLDNPGWALDVRIEDTELDGVLGLVHQAPLHDFLGPAYLGFDAVVAAHLRGGSVSEGASISWGFGHPDSERRCVDGVGGRD